MAGRNGFIVSVFLVFILALSGALFAQRVIDLDKVWGDMRVLGKAANDRSGSAVAYGDINGDGFMDLIIGAPQAKPGERFHAGETYVIFGSGSPPSSIDLNTQSADITICGAEAYDRCGRAVASGDFNGDEYDDIIIGAPYASPGGRTNAGETYVIFGSSNPPSTIDLNTTPADITVCGAVSMDNSGYAVAGGDVNGDGFDDIIIGAPLADPGDPPRWAAGETYVIFGASFSSPPYILDLSSWPADITVCGDADWDQ
ncbi:MAG: FG-GAP repeat protein, partial [Desulfobacterales bacterium]|nr:FG-GAP repeat protein [Desulfobacterales bacterium]